MANKKEVSIEEKLRALYDLQLVDSRIDDIKNMRGELPLEVEDLDAEVEGLTKRVEKLEKEAEDAVTGIKDKKIFIDEANSRIKKYKDQQDNVRNNREFDSLSKEIEYQELEIELAEKHIREFNAKIEHKKQIIEDAQSKLEERSNHLEHKKSELEGILKDTEKEEASLAKKADELKENIEERLVKAYERIRKNVKNGLAVVTIERGAAGGSFFTIPPQVQMEIASRRKIMTDEHSGRILVDQELAKEEEDKMHNLFANI
jgi:predicted  nucleic acid-binding Zn-ribbon protein